MARAKEVDPSYIFNQQLSSTSKNRDRYKPNPRDVEVRTATQERLHQLELDRLAREDYY